MADTVIPIAALAGYVKLTIEADSGFVGLNKINPEERLNVGGNIQLNYPSNGNGDVFIKTSQYDFDGSVQKINLHLLTPDTVSGGDIKLTPGNSTFNNAFHGRIILNRRVQMIQDTTDEYFNWDEYWSSTYRWMGDFNNKVGNVQSNTPIDLPAKDYDRWFCSASVGNGQADIFLYIEDGIGSGIYRSSQRALLYNSISCPIPSGCRFRVKVEGSGSALSESKIYFSIFKFGRQ